MGSAQGEDLPKAIRGLDPPDPDHGWVFDRAADDDPRRRERLCGATAGGVGGCGATPPTTRAKRGGGDPDVP